VLRTLKKSPAQVIFYNGQFFLKLKSLNNTFLWESPMLMDGIPHMLKPGETFSILEEKCIICTELIY